MDLSKDMARWMADHPHDPVWLAGHGTRIVRPEPMTVFSAPVGIRSFVPEEMTVTCGAGTPVDELMKALDERGQFVNLPVRTGASGTVGGALAVGEGDVLRFGRGSVRDVLLQAIVVRSTGETVKVGGPTVKNVSGFDLCRLLVGSCGRLGFITEVIVRTRPKPQAMSWLRTEAPEWQSVSTISRHVHRPSALLWTGHDAYLCIEGHPADLLETRRDLEKRLGCPMYEERPHLESFPHRRVCSPADVRAIVATSPGSCLAEIGTGVVHFRDVAGWGETDGESRLIEGRLLAAFDPHDRLNGGTRIWGREHCRRT